jgi:pentatricopeptide repeat protein
LFKMSQRNFPLTQALANRMLDTYSSRGRTGKAVHYFYSVHRTPMEASGGDGGGDEGGYHHETGEEYALEDDDSEEEKEDMSQISGLNYANLPHAQPRPFMVRIKLNNPPPFHKIPTEVAGKFLAIPKKKKNNKHDSSNQRRQSKALPPPQPNNEGVLKIDRENDRDWSLPLTAAFSFADSLSHGACGHDPIQLDLVSYNILIKTCVYRGALWRAMHLIDTVMPGAGIEPDHRSYDNLLSGLARVADVTLMREYYHQMISKNIDPSLKTVQCIVDGLLNLGDVAGAITVVQDFFNQHSVLPPVATHLKLLEFALGLGMTYEAKRHVYFIQQLWKWQPHYKYDSKNFIYYMKAYQQDRRISKDALKHLFVYFGESLEDSDFF